MTMFNFNAIVANGKYLVHVTRDGDDRGIEFNFTTYADAYRWSKFLVVFSKGSVTIGIYKNDNRICCITGTDAPWYGKDIISVWTIYKGGTKIRMSEKRQPYVDKFLHN